ncbi:MAG TPA: hypothetical protein VGL80_05410 [Pseudonocardiaceae bacterium]|jgi:hypothetical protein
MGVVAVGILVGVVWLLIVLLRRRTKRRTKDTIVDPLHVPTLNVVSVGMQGSGKTILLASMYRCMQTPAGRDYYLRAPHEQVIELGSWYHDVADPGGHWPAGTSKAEMREFRFDVMARTSGASAAVLRLNYLEYAGELLTDVQAPGATAQTRLLTAVEQADALIGIIDGLRVWRAYQGDGRSAAMLQRSVDTMVSTMYQARGPITFVITKWDLLTDLHPDENTRLRMVRTMLLDSPGFRDLVREHSARRVLRLIPVTAVGHDFAQLRDDSVQKKPGGKLRPVNVDLPLSGVVPDVLLQLELSLDRATRATIMAEARKRAGMRPAEAAATLGAVVAQVAGRTLAAVVGPAAIGLFVEAGMSLLMDLRDRRDPQQGSAALDAADTRVDEFIMARRKVIRALHDQVSRLEATLPSSRLEIEV